MKILFRKGVNFLRRLVTPTPKPPKFDHVSIMKGTVLSGENLIGEYSYIGFNCFITKSEIGRFCSIANNVSIGVGEHKIKRVSTSSLFYPSPYETLTENSCTIGNDVWVGANCVIRRGVKVGDGAVIGANSFVNKDVEAYSIVAGSPAKFIKMRFTQEQIKEITDSKYWEADLDGAKIKIKKLEQTGLFEKNDR